MMDLNLMLKMNLVSTLTNVYRILVVHIATALTLKVHTHVIVTMVMLTMMKIPMHVLISMNAQTVQHASLGNYVITSLGRIHASTSAQ